MNPDNIPWRETAIIILVIWLTMGLNNMELKARYVEYIAEHPWFRNFIVFALSFLTFSLDLSDRYSLITKIVVSAIVAWIFHYFFSADATLFELTPAPIQQGEESAVYPFAG